MSADLPRGFRADAPRGKDSSRWKGGRLTRHNGYVLVWCEQPHPHACRTGKNKSAAYVLEHILVAERALGRFLPPDAVIHHVNGIRADNRPENLVICQNSGYHQVLHRRQRAFEACGHADWRLCTHCGKYDSPQNLYVSEKRSRSHHRECSRVASRERYWQDPERARDAARRSWHKNHPGGA